ncbi:hypothetical protein BB561_000841 [Smittium simulii]|uniref:NAD(+) synthase (glutamine-hydrolyzing) n=1 Tax=Smittium simulii TaxID=133385 RepID=A0A2T9YXH4_9FUNG|nr:hypothetical protein BB561_000841 [Smittium simulii]
MTSIELFNEFPYLVRTNDEAYAGYIEIEANIVEIRSSKTKKHNKTAELITLDTCSAGWNNILTTGFSLKVRFSMKNKTISNEQHEALNKTSIIKEDQSVSKPATQHSKLSSHNAILFLELLNTELYDLGWDNIEYYDPATFECKLRYKDAKQRNFEIVQIVASLGDDPKVKLASMIIKPQCIPLSKLKSGWLCSYFRFQAKMIEKYQPALDILQEINEQCYVLKAYSAFEQTDTKTLESGDQSKDVTQYEVNDQYFRVNVALGDLVSIEFNIDTETPSNPPSTIQLHGPAEKIKNASKRSTDLIENLQIMLGTRIKRYSSCNTTGKRKFAGNDDTLDSSDIKITCGVCFGYEMEGNEFPSELCDNPKCKQPFHHSCLLKWLQSSNTKQNFRMVFGKCPYCQHLATMPQLLTIATCSLNQWSLDFTGNYTRIKDSILQAKAQNAHFRLGSELEIPQVGYSCQDHFFEADTITHSWQVLAKLLSDPDLYGIVIITGMPVMHRNCRYNCAVVLYNGQIVLIRPKMWMASDGNYRELRWFTPYINNYNTTFLILPQIIQSIKGQTTAVFGHALLESSDGTLLGLEICEEFNQNGCDGDRLYFDGSSMVFSNGELLATTPQFSLQEVNLAFATVDLDSVKSYRASIASLSSQSSFANSLPKVSINISIYHDIEPLCVYPTCSIVPQYLTPEQEIAYGPACWLWDYLRRSNQGGFFLALSGGVDSCSVAMITFSMCDIVCAAVRNNNSRVITDLNAILGYDPENTDLPTDPKKLSNLIIHTCYMATENSSSETQLRAQKLAAEINSYHISLDFSAVVASILSVFAIVTNRTPQYTLNGGSNPENLALQNIQARLRMVLAYLFAALILWVRGRSRSLLVLGSSNVDECLRGYFTKYDCSSADLNPIGSISKQDLYQFIKHMQQFYYLDLLEQFLVAVPSAELIPTTNESSVQSDEVEMGMSYKELQVFGSLRKVYNCGPLSMFQQLVILWKSLHHSEIAAKVKRFFFFYSINRHKMTTLTPAYHAEAYSPDDNRFDHRPFLYNSTFKWQFDQIDNLVALQTSKKKKD